MGFVELQDFQVSLLAIPAEFEGSISLKKQKGKWFDPFQVVLMEEIAWMGPLKKIKQDQTPAPAVGWLVGVFYECSIEQAGYFATSRSNDPSPLRFCIAREEQHIL
mgnify:FL=1